MIPALVAALLPGIGTAVSAAAERLFPGRPEDQRQVQEAVTAELVQRGPELAQAAAGVVQSEVASGHWLAANWRPITALVFVAMLVARAIGWTSPAMSEAEWLRLYGLIEIMIGGYVVARTAEKLLPGVVDAVRSRL